MTSTTLDRINGINSGIAIKAPCRVRTTANITLSGLQTIDGVALAADDRVLVMAQSTQSENGIYKASTGSWVREPDFDGNRDIVNGTLVYVTAGSVYAESLWVVTSANPITIGTTSITFDRAAFDANGYIAATSPVVDSEIVLFSGVTGDAVKRATGTGYVKVTSGVIQTPAATVPLSDLATQAANTVVANATASTAAPTAVSVGASQLLGRGSTGNVAPITLGTNLSMSGTTLNAAGIFTQSYTSAEQTISLAGGLTLAHSLSGSPRLIRTYLICKTAEHNYSIDDKLEVNFGTPYTGTSVVASGAAVTFDATNIYVRFGATNILAALLNKTTGAFVTFTIANWKLVVEAYY
jgi:hypothetical protein